MQSTQAMSFDALREETLQRMTVRVFRLRVHLLLPLFAVVFVTLFAVGIEAWRAWALGGLGLLIGAGFVWDARRVGRLHVDDAFFRRYIPVIAIIQTALITVTGGLHSPLLPVYLPLAWVAGTVLRSARDVALVPAIIAAALILMGVTEGAGGLPSVPGFGVEGTHLAALGLIVLVMTAVSSITATIAWRTARAYEDIDRRLDAARAEALAAHEERLRTVESLSRRVAHEVRNPLAAIKGLTQLLQRRGDPSGHLAVIASEVERLQEILDGFLSRPLDDLRPAETDACALVRDVVSILEARLAQGGVAVSLELPATAPVRADPARLKQVLLNLMLNAAEAMEQGAGGRRLSVRVDAGDPVCVRIGDTGPGVDPARAEHLFEPSVSSKENGTGLGLPISRAIVHAHGGSLSLAATDRGAEATVTLPRGGPARLETA
ncbi:MAG: hypothetical protein AMXMBFR64_38320 [Myxococcales bacterium]